MDGVLFVLRTGFQWNALNATGICSSSVAHRRFQAWVAAGVYSRLWAASAAYDVVMGIDWGRGGHGQRAGTGRGVRAVGGLQFLVPQLQR